MKSRLLIVLLAFKVSACIGSNCYVSDGPSDYAILTDLVVDPATGIAIVPSARQRVLDECEGRVSEFGVLHALDPEAGDANTLTSPVIPAGAVIADGQLIVLAGTWSQIWGVISGPYPGLEYFRAPLEAPNSGERVALPSAATGIVAVGSHAFLPLPAMDAILVLTLDTPDGMISVAPRPEAVAVVGEKVLVATESGFVSEIDAVSLTETRRLDACPARSIAALGPQNILLACDDGGLGVVDLVAEAFALHHTDQQFSLVMGNDAGPAAVAYDTTDTTRVFVLGSGLVGPGYGGRAVDALFPGTGSAIALIDGALIFLPLDGGDPTRHLGFPYHLGAMGVTPAGSILGAGSWAGDPPDYKNGSPVFVTVDPATGEVVGPAVGIPHRNADGGCGCALAGAGSHSPLRFFGACLLVLVAVSRRRIASFRCRNSRGTSLCGATRGSGCTEPPDPPP